MINGGESVSGAEEIVADVASSLLLEHLDPWGLGSFLILIASYNFIIGSRNPLRNWNPL